MGYIRHHAIAITSWNKENIKSAHEKAKELFEDLTTEIIESKINRYLSFFIAPDGSKEGWPESLEGDDHRNEFIKWINEQSHGDGSNNLSYAEFYYGDDEGYSNISNHN